MPNEHRMTERRITRRALLRLCCFAAVSSFVILISLLKVAVAADSDKKPAPFQLQPGEFPPEGSAHSIAGELILMDHVNRTGQLRPDRRDDQRTDDYDRAMAFALL